MAELSQILGDYINAAGQLILMQCQEIKARVGYDPWWKCLVEEIAMPE